MTKKEYIQTMEDLFGHPGWKLIEDDARREIGNLQADALDTRVCPTWDEVNIRRGRAIALNELLLLPSIIQTMKDQDDDED